MLETIIAIILVTSAATSLMLAIAVLGIMGWDLFINRRH